MLNHTTWLISKMDLIKYIFEKPALTGRITRWQMLLSEYDIEYHTQKAIKIVCWQIILLTSRLMIISLLNMISLMRM